MSADDPAAALPRTSEIELDDEFSRLFPELSVAWSSSEPKDPQLLVANEGLMRELGLDPAFLHSPDGVRFLLGNLLATGSTPVAQLYAGHQFGSFNPRLGDGRALLLGELTSSDGRLHDLHLKGSGRTPFARADGFAAVGPMLREYLMGEAMHALGIPTTRALSVVGTRRRVQRDSLLPGAVLTRVASSHLRVGSFQYALNTGNLGLLRRLADHAIERHYPHLASSETGTDVDDNERGARYLGLLRAVISAHATLVSSWMHVGFVHGVLNTDNVTISGETIDYGPCAFIETYDPATVFSSIDHDGRYAYGHQPQITRWNLSQFARCLLPLIHDSTDEAVALATAALEGFTSEYDQAWSEGMRSKLGITHPDRRNADLNDAGLSDAVLDDAALDDAALDDASLTTLAAGLLDDLRTHNADYTSFFRGLADAAVAPNLAAATSIVHQLLGSSDDPGAWVERWWAMRPSVEEMNRSNPVYIPRNHLVEAALVEAEDGDFTLFTRLLGAVTDPFESRADREMFASPAPSGTAVHRTYCGT